MIFLNTHNRLLWTRNSIKEIAAHNADAIRKLKQLRNITELRYFLELCKVFRHFVPNAACIVALLNRKS